MTLQYLRQARAMRSALVNRLFCAAGAVFMGVLSTPSVDFLEFFSGNRNRHHFSDDVGCHELQLVCHCEVGTAKLKMKMKMRQRVSPWLSAIPPSSLAIDTVIEVLTLLMLWMDRYQSLFCLRQVSISHFSGIVLGHRQNLVAVEEVSGAHQHSNEESNVWRSVIVQLVSFLFLPP